MKPLTRKLMSIINRVAMEEGKRHALEVREALVAECLKLEGAAESLDEAAVAALVERRPP